MFDYTKFENDIVLQLEHILKKWMKEKDDIYILSLDCARGVDSIGAIANTMEYLEEQALEEPEDYWYYKYCEDEWELFDTFEEISANMRIFVENNESFTNKENYEYTEEFDAHFDKIIEVCKNALCRLKQSVSKDYPKLLLTLNVREYFDEEERIETFKLINGGNATEEYAEHVEDFV